MYRIERAPPLRAAVGKLCLCLCLVLPSVTGCAAVGPDWQRPGVKTGQGYDPSAMPPSAMRAASSGAVAQSVRIGRDIPGDWWTLFHSPAINDLVQQALHNNPDIDAAQATLRQARELALAERGSGLPALIASLGSSRQQEPQSYQVGSRTPALLYNDQSARLDLSYVPDFWGSYRRSVEEARAQVDYQHFQLEAAYLAISAGVVTTAIQWASVQQQIEAQEQLIDFAKKQLDTVQHQFELGATTGSDVATQRAQVAQAYTVLMPLRTQRDIQRHQLAAYLGKTPADTQLPDIDFDALSLPGDLPLSLPSSLIAQRPDVRAAEALWHAQTAALGVDVAQRLPQITLSVAYGSDSSELGGLFSPTNVLWSLVGQAVQSVFDGGQLKHKEAAQRQRLVAADAAWRSRVVAAFQNVSDVLSTVRDGADNLHYAMEAKEAAGRSLSLASGQFRLGGVSYLNVLAAQQIYQTAVIALVRAQASRYIDSVALYQSLGGGWWNRADVAQATQDMREAR